MKSTVDWEQAFAFYATLPPGERSYQTVADKFGVSARTVETHGRNERWKARLREIQAQAAADTQRALREKWAEKMLRRFKLVDASELLLIDKIRRGTAAIKPTDLLPLINYEARLFELLERFEAAQQPDKPEPRQQRTPEHVTAVVEALAESGTLAAIGLIRLETPLQVEPEQEPG